MKLYTIWKASPILQCLGEHEITLVLASVHKGPRHNHIGKKTLAHKLIRVEYYWPTLLKDNVSFVKKCDQFQRNVDLHHTLAELFHLMTSL